MVQLQEFYVFSKAGVPIVTFRKDDAAKVNDVLLGCAISSIGTFCSTFSGKEIKGFNVGDHKFTLIPALEKQIILVCKTPNDEKKKNIEKMCNILGSIFEDMFKLEDIENWNGDLSFFDKFKNRLDIYFRVSDL